MGYIDKSREKKVLLYFSMGDYVTCNSAIGCVGSICILCSRLERSYILDDNMDQDFEDLTQTQRNKIFNLNALLKEYK